MDNELKIAWTMLWTMLDNVSLVTTASYRLRCCVERLAPIPSFFEQSM
jgi:hypothetical protein